MFKSKTSPDIKNMVLSEKILEKYRPAAKVLSERLDFIPASAVIAGSGIAESLDKNKIKGTVKYSELPGLPLPTVLGHDGEILIYEHENHYPVIFSGRFHNYEGRTFDEVCSLVIVSYLAGIRKIILTNAAGALNPHFNLGDIMLIEDTIDFMFNRELQIFESPYIESERKPKKSVENEYNDTLKKSLIGKGIPFRQGTYVSVTGPNYETRAEIRMLRKMGADAVGMSTVPELKTAKSLGMDVIACSLITNSSKEVTQIISHHDVINVASIFSAKVRQFIETAVSI